MQGYAYAAARAGADLLEAFGRGGTDRWRAWAQHLRVEFHRRFWVEDAKGPFPAIALDGDKRPVVSLTSNVGHLLGTGLLSVEEVDAVARRLAAPDMLSGFGVRTMSRDAAGYSPTGYHVGLGLAPRHRHLPGRPGGRGAGRGGARSPRPCCPR